VRSLAPVVRDLKSELTAVCQCRRIIASVAQSAGSRWSSLVLIITTGSLQRCSCWTAWCLHTSSIGYQCSSSHDLPRFLINWELFGVRPYRPQIMTMTATTMTTKRHNFVKFIKRCPMNFICYYDATFCREFAQSGQCTQWFRCPSGPGRSMSLGVRPCDIRRSILLVSRFLHSRIPQHFYAVFSMQGRIFQPPEYTPE